MINQHQAMGVTRIRVRIGPLAGVVPELLASAFSLAAAGSRMEHAELDLADAPIRVRCQTCGAESEAAMNRLTCAACGDWQVDVTSGEQMLLRRVEIETAEAAVH